MCIGRRLLSAALSLLMLMMTAAHADVPFLVHSDGWNLEDTPVEVLLHADVDTHMPYDADRLAMLTPITDALSLRLMAGRDEGLVSILLENQELLTLQQLGNAVQLSCLPEVTYTASEDAMSLLLGADVSIGGYEALGLPREGESLITDGRALLSKLPETMEGYAKASKSQQQISGYGRAESMVDFVFTAKQVEEFKTLLLSCCPDGWLRDIISGLTFTGKQTVRMYFAPENVLLRMEYNGGCGPDGDLRTVKLVYKQRRDDDMDKDYIELTSPAKKGTNKNTLTFERTAQTNTKGERVLSGSFKYSATKDGVNSITNGEFALQNAWDAASDRISGKVTIQRKLNGAEKYDAITLAPTLTISGTQNEPSIVGNLEITEQYAGKTTEHAVVRIDLKKAALLTWTERAQKVDLSGMDENALCVVQMQVASQVATALIRPLIVRFGKDAQWFFRDLPEEAIQSIMDAAAPAANEGGK